MAEVRNDINGKADGEGGGTFIIYFSPTQDFTSGITADTGNPLWGAKRRIFLHLKNSLYICTMHYIRM